MDEDNVGAAAELLRGAERVVALTGAGISAESGVPTFRGQDGLWKTYRAQELATPEAFRADPTLVWEWYEWRRGRVAAVEPNPGHRILARWAAVFRSFTLITQNVDGLHARAGSVDVLELHGNIWKLRCTAEGTVVEDRRHPLPKLPPHCSSCGALLRPHIVWFGESLDGPTITRAFAASQASNVMLVIGTSAVVHPAASLPFTAAGSGARVIEINPEPTPLTATAHLSLRGQAGLILPAIDERLGTLRQA